MLGARARGPPFIPGNPGAYIAGIAALLKKVAMRTGADQPTQARAIHHS